MAENSGAPFQLIFAVTQTLRAVGFIWFHVCLAMQGQRREYLRGKGVLFWTQILDLIRLPGWPQVALSSPIKWIIATSQSRRWDLAKGHPLSTGPVWVIASKQQRALPLLASFVLEIGCFQVPFCSSWRCLPPAWANKCTALLHWRV